MGEKSGKLYVICNLFMKKGFSISEITGYCVRMVMAEELQGILDKINANGIKKAQAAGEVIISAARLEAEKIIADAKAPRSSRESSASSFTDQSTETCESGESANLPASSRINSAINSGVSVCATQPKTARLILVSISLRKARIKSLAA